MAKREALEELFARHGFTDFKWIKSKDITVAQWVRLGACSAARHTA